MKISKSVTPESKTIKLFGSITTLDMDTISFEFTDIHCFDSVIIDLSYADFIDSGFLGFLTSLKMTRPKDFKKLKLENPNNYILDILKTTGLTNLLPVRQSN